MKTIEIPVHAYSNNKITNNPFFDDRKTYHWIKNRFKKAVVTLQEFALFKICDEQNITSWWANRLSVMGETSPCSAVMKRDISPIQMSDTSCNDEQTIL